MTVFFLVIILLMNKKNRCISLCPLFSVLIHFNPREVKDHRLSVRSGGGKKGRKGRDQLSECYLTSKSALCTLKLMKPKLFCSTYYWSSMYVKLEGYMKRNKTESLKIVLIQYNISSKDVIYFLISTFIWIMFKDLSYLHSNGVIYICLV